jgi:hypothetical protein
MGTVGGGQNLGSPGVGGGGVAVVDVGWGVQAEPAVPTGLGVCCGSRELASIWGSRGHGVQIPPSRQSLRR